MTEEELRRLAELINAGRRSGPSLWDTTLLSAIFAGLVSLLTLWLSNHFQRRSKEDEYKRQQQEWFLERQARDIEEIINTLERFSKELGESFREVGLRIANSATLESVEPDDFFWSSSEKTREEKEDAERTLFQQLLNRERSITAWFSYDLMRLTAWLEDFQLQQEKLVRMGIFFSHVYAGLNLALMANHQASIELLKPFDERDHSPFLEADRHLEEALKEWTELIQDAHTFQRELIKSLREG